MLVLKMSPDAVLVMQHALKPLRRIFEKRFGSASYMLNLLIFLGKTQRSPDLEMVANQTQRGFIPVKQPWANSWFPSQ